MKTPAERPEQVAEWFVGELAGLWPAVLGSLSLRRSPCVRAQCAACQSGEQHPSYVLYGRHRGRRFGIYIPDDLAGEIRRALANGHRLQELLYEAAQRYARALKHERAAGG